mmetsp:Transcript_13198/g.40827  ORF Transcript_13198/g.40827 Transcript_13198/m.40827 type:complete len:329 (+) Transcript_13198:1048-2034(+)
MPLRDDPLEAAGQVEARGALHEPRELVGGGILRDQLRPAELGPSAREPRNGRDARKDEGAVVDEVEEGQRYPARALVGAGQVRAELVPLERVGAVGDRRHVEARVEVELSAPVGAGLPAVAAGRPGPPEAGEPMRRKVVDLHGVGAAPVVGLHGIGPGEAAVGLHEHALHEEEEADAQGGHLGREAEGHQLVAAKDRPLAGPPGPHGLVELLTPPEHAAGALSSEGCLGEGVPQREGEGIHVQLARVVREPEDLVRVKLFAQQGKGQDHHPLEDDQNAVTYQAPHEDHPPDLVVAARLLVLRPRGLLRVEQRGLHARRPPAEGRRAGR